MNKRWNEGGAHHFPRHPVASPFCDLPWLVAHRGRFHLRPTMNALPRGQTRRVACVQTRRVEMSHELSVALPKRGLGGAQGEVGQESRALPQVRPWLCCCPWWHTKADGEGVIVGALEATHFLDPLPDRVAVLVDVNHRREKKSAPREETTLAVRAWHVRGATRRRSVPRCHVPGFGSLMNRVLARLLWKRRHLRVLRCRLPSLDHGCIGETWHLVLRIGI